MKKKTKRFVALLMASAMTFSLTVSGSAEEVVSGTVDVVNVAASDPSDCQPFKTDKGTKSMFLQVYQSLYDLDPDTGELCAVLADASRGEYGGYDIIDETTYHIYIYDYIYDHAGNHVTASDVAFTYMHNIEEGYKSYYSKLDQAVAVDDTTVELQLSAPIENVGELTPYLVNIWVYTEAAYEASPSQFATDTCGTGPYIMTEFVSGSSITLEKNEDYWQTDESLTNERNQAYADKIVYNFMSEETQIVIGLESGSIDFATKISLDSCVDFLEGGSYEDEVGVSVLEDNKQCCLLPNCDESSPMSDVNLRLAVYYAIDNASVVQALGSGTAIATSTLGLSTGCSDYNPEWEEKETYMSTYDPELAKEYLAQSSYNGETLVLMANTDDNGKYETAAIVIQAFLQAVGINCELMIESKSTVDTLRLDPSNFDMEIASPSFTSYVMEEYKYIFNTDSTETGLTQWYIGDDELMDLYYTAYALETTGTDSMNALYDYIIENGYAYGMFQNYSATAYRTDKIVSVTYQGQHLPVPGSNIYVAE
ncbi:MAG: ABC transporter substrate-binding protein [Lachnospiraceae bacterium]|nr:ABC transporter substrate-binding protein [Lachnospiraceae bacterium]